MYIHSGAALVGHGPIHISVRAVVHRIFRIRWPTWRLQRRPRRGLRGPQASEHVLFALFCRLRRQKRANKGFGAAPQGRCNRHGLPQQPIDFSLGTVISCRQPI